MRPAPLVLAVAGYALLAILARVTTGGEIYPFFTWDLFSRIPAEQLRPTIHLEAVGDERFETALPLFGSDYGRASDIVGSQLVDSLVHALRDDAGEQTRLLAALRRQHLPPDATWSVVWEGYDPIERVRGLAPRTFEAARFGPAGDPVPDDHRLDPAAGIVTGPDGRWTVRDAPAGVLTSVAPWEDGGLRISGWAGDPVTGALPRRIVVFSGSRPIAYAGVGASGHLAVETTGNDALDRAGFSRVIPPEYVPAGTGDLTVLALFPDGSARRLSEVGA